MSTFLFAYRSPKGYETGPDTAGSWNAWFQNLGSSVTDVGNPIFDRSAVGETGTKTELGGYTLVSADDLGAALALARGCPLVGNGGGVEVGEITPLSAESMQSTADDHARATGLAG